MRKDIHPESYRFVVFKDVSCDHTFLTRSTASSKETIKWTDGKEYPLIKLEISDKSHPFYTGKMKLVDTAGRVDKFKNRYSKVQQEQLSTREAMIAAIKEAQERAAAEAAAKLEAEAQAETEEPAENKDQEESESITASADVSAEQEDESEEEVMPAAGDENIDSQDAGHVGTVDTEGETEIK